MSTASTPSLVPVPNFNQDQLLLFLFKNGHFGDLAWDEVKALKASSVQAEDAMASFQQFHGLQVQGVATDETQRLIRQPRCGLPDILRAGSCKWPMLDVTWSQRISLSTMDAAAVERVFAQAIAQWNAVCGIRLARTDDFNAANIYAQAGRIDGASSTLAYSYLPCGASRTSRMQQVYDSAERWTDNFLLGVACHEIGHAIGLDHDSSGQLMAPYYSGNILSPQSKDIAQVVSRYGKPAPVPVPPPPGPTPDPTPTPGGIVIGGQITLNGFPYRLVPVVDHSGI